MPLSSCPIAAVADRARVAAHPEHADFAVGQIVPQVVPDPDIEAWHDGADGARLHGARLVRDEDVPHLGGAETIEIGRAHVWTPVTSASRMASSACKRKKTLAS